jgi:hypothetical protein
MLFIGAAAGQLASEELSALAKRQAGWNTHLRRRMLRNAGHGRQRPHGD